MRQLVIRGWQFLRACWLVIGVSLLLLLALEAGVRLVRKATGADNPRDAVPDAYASAAWYGGFIRDYDATRPQRWLSYLYFGRLPSYHGRYVNIDSLGHRVTPQPAVPAVPSAQVFFFGGSTMWGTAQRDDHTIAAEAARRLQTVAGPGARIEVTNFGESGYVFTQDVIDLMLQLRAGARPDVVVFYDGINDVFATLQSGVAGVPQNESKRAAEFALGRVIDRTGYARGPRKDLHAIGVLAVTAFRQLALVDWLVARLPHRPVPLLPADSAARTTVRVYAGTVRLVEALSREYHFTPIYVWQPSVHATEKKLTAYEQRVMAGIRSDSFQSRLQQIHRAIAPILDSAMQGVAPGRFINASALFRDDTATVFADRIGHNVESSVPEIVDTFWPALRTAVTRVGHH